jgi:hypothetical protein
VLSRPFEAFFVATTLHSPSPIYFHMPDSMKQGILAEGEGSVPQASSYQHAQISYFSRRNCTFLFYKTSYLLEEANCTDTSPSARIPCMKALEPCLSFSPLSPSFPYLSVTTLSFGVVCKNQHHLNDWQLNKRTKQPKWLLQHIAHVLNHIETLAFS